MDATNVKTKSIVLTLWLLPPFLFSVNTSNVNAQNKILNKKISILAENEQTESVLKQISKKGRFYFSYNSDIINLDKKISIQKENTTVNEIIEALFEQKISAIETGNYIILKKNTNPQEEEKPVVNKLKQ
ncbi:MAG: hypothetical protein B6I20_12355 [Bacteroidetes bacterium 4572_117]|nr:MAG: hypothetical protein B6I20_12355 [Bacteroidetes bacterium 4572_117]